MIDETQVDRLEYSDLPPVLIFVDNGSARASAEEAVRAAGGRVSASLPVRGAVERLRGQATLQAVLLEVDADTGDELDELLDHLEAGARSGRHSSIITVPRPLIDLAAARASHSRVQLLCEPDEQEHAAAIGAAITRHEARLFDVGSDASPSRLRDLSEEVARIAKTLAALASEDGTRPGGQASPAPGAPAAVDAGMIRTLIRIRRLREQFFPADLFADPAWDMLLDLAAARLEGRAVAVSSLCIASAVPPTTALRWIKTLTDGNLLARVADSNDGRRVFIELSDAAANGIMAYMAARQRLIAARG
ncbi:MAG: MarR family transcriptional regulator [Sphingomonas bacterium]|jgi:hypothetical protein|nr:MarR family transcriptional regulator [Sphingomonas bacterium]MDB5717863.1 MarR family transcriptional regulator [Sphingomonas bacterium]